MLTSATAGPEAHPAPDPRSLATREHPDNPRTPRRLRPVHVILSAVLAAGFYAITSPVDDLDSYWHVVLGRQILRQHSLANLGRSWLAVPAGSWTTSQWLSEVAMALAVDHGGWRALVVGRLLLAAALVVSLWAALWRRHPVLLVTPIALLMAGAVFGFVQDRPQSASLVFLPWAAAWAYGLLLHGRRPPLIAVTAISLVWAQLHGLWVLMPAAFALAALGCALDGPRDRRRAVRDSLLACALSCAGVLSPQGLQALLLPWRFRSSTGAITEWQPTTLTHGFIYCFAGLVLIVLAFWTGGIQQSPRRSERLWLCLWVLYAALAFRNVPVAAIFVAPATLTALERRWPAASSPGRPASGRIESAVLAAVCVTVLAVGGVLTIQRLVTLDPLKHTPALRIAERIAAGPGPVRVWNDYAASGSLIAFGGGRPRLVIDGRTDLWGNARIVSVIDVAELGQGWRQRLNDFRPDLIVMVADAPLVTLLTTQGSWHTVLVDGRYVLLEPTHPGTAAAG